MKTAISTQLDPLLIDERAAAKLLGVSVRTLFSLRKRLEIPFIRIGGQVRYCPDALKGWIRSGSIGGNQ